MNAQALEHVGYIFSQQEMNPNLIRYCLSYGQEEGIGVAAAGIHQFIQENPTLCPLFPSGTVEEIRNQLPGKKYVLIHNRFITLSKRGPQSLTKYPSKESHKDIFFGVRVDIPVRCGQGVHTLEKAHALFWSNVCISKGQNAYCPACGEDSQMAEYEPSPNATTSTYQAELKVDEALRAEIHRSVPRKNCVTILRDIYDSATNYQQKKACISYLLHYQHYNAEFTESESERLGYPIPLIAVEEDSGYVRTESHRLLSILETWIQSHLMPILNEAIDFSGISFSGSSGIPYLFKACSRTTVKIFSMLFPERMKDIVIIELRDGCNLENIRSQVVAKKAQGDKFLFLYHVENVDCVIIWIALGDPLKIELFESVFGDNVLLSIAGGVPDRLAVNDFAIQAFVIGEFEQALQNIGITPPTRGSKSHYRTWSEMIRAIASYDFRDDEGSRLYSSAIRRWNECFFKFSPITEVVSGLLMSEVCSWISEEAGIVQWAKAYQNLCEIVMFCIQYSPDTIYERVEEFDKTILNYLYSDVRFIGIDKSVELYSYGMSSVFDILCRILNCSKIKTRAACIGQNYFETLKLIEKMTVLGHFTFQKSDSLDEIIGAPDVLIADIHPNNAARSKLFPNDVTSWVCEYLENNPSKEMVLILDITLNNLSDNEVRHLLVRLLPFIRYNRLEIYLVQSLAKLVQLGADNFSGGISICLRPFPTRESSSSTTTSSTTLHKKMFFSLLTRHFQDIIIDYFRQIRSNTEWVYHRLNEEFSEIGKSVWIEKKSENENDKEPGRRGFCAANLTLNGDHNTVYVAINFEPLFDVVGLRVPVETDTNKVERQQIIKEREEHVNGFLELILELAIQRNIPLTGRQSFGFSLSNISGAVDSIRLSIGVEKQSMLEKNVEIISVFCNLLSNYVAKQHTRVKKCLADLKGFQEEVKQLCIETREGRVYDFQKLISELATKWEILLTGCQNFGFSLSNISGAVDPIRLSIGAEKQSMLEENVEIISVFYNLLSNYVEKQRTWAEKYLVELKGFREGVERLCDVLSDQETLPPFRVPLFEENLEYDQIGKAKICFRDSRLKLKATSKNEDGNELITQVSQADIQMGYHGMTFGYSLSSLELMQLLFHHICFGHDSIHAVVNQHVRKRYVIGGVNDHKMRASKKHPLLDLDSQSLIGTGGTFSLKWHGRVYGIEDVFVFVEGVGSLPIKFSQLNRSKLHRAYTKCVKFRLEAEEYEEVFVLLKFVEEKHKENYADWIYQVIRLRGFPALATLLNGLDFANLPLPHDYSWDGYSSHINKALNSLHAELRRWGYAIAVGNLNETLIRNTISPTIAQIANSRCKLVMIDGLIEGLFDGSLESKPLSEEAAKALEELLSSNGDSNHIDQRFERWIAFLEKKLNDEQFDRRFIRSYFLALFPIITNLCSDLFETRFSMPLRRIAEVLYEYQELKGYFTYLESRLIFYLGINENKFKPRQITRLLEVYVNYPLQQNTKDQIIAILKNDSTGIREQWVNAP